MNCRCKAGHCQQYHECRRCKCLCLATPFISDNIYNNRSHLNRAARRQKRVRYNEDDPDNDFQSERDELSDVLLQLGLTTLSHNLPASRRHVRVADASIQDLSRCDRVLKEINKRLCELMYPADPVSYRQRFLAENKNKTLSTSNDVFVALKATKRGSIERRVLRGLLCTYMKRKDIDTFLVANNLDLIGEVEGEDEDYKLTKDSAHGDSVTKISPLTYTRSRHDWDTLLV